jgi:hypothetical protein
MSVVGIVTGPDLLRRGATVATTLAVSLGASPGAGAARPSPSAPNAVFFSIIATVKAGTAVSLYLPAYVPTDEKALYAQVLTVRRSEYWVELNREKGCGDADVCDEGFVAGFSSASAPAYSGTRVALSNGLQAYYKPTVCAGAGCTTATLSFPIAGNVYEIGLKAGRKRELLQIANSLVEAR